MNLNSHFDACVLKHAIRIVHRKTGLGAQRLREMIGISRQDFYRVVDGRRVPLHLEKRVWNHLAALHVSGTVNESLGRKQ
jgi:hypothetical protein